MARKEIPRELSIYINDKQVVNSLAGITREISRTNNEMRNLNKNSETYDKDLAQLEKHLSDLTKKQSEFKDELGLTNKTLSESTGFLGKLSNSIGPVASGLLSAFSIGAVVTSFFGAIKAGFKTINDFEQSVADLSAITGATGDDLKYLKEQAIDLGEKTIGGANQVIEAYKLIASAKPELLDNVEALNQVTEATIILSQAAGMQLPEAATALTDAMNQFNAPAEQAAFFVDALANGAKSGAAEIPDITAAVLKFGAVAKTSNIDIKESVSLVELLAENGLKGAEAGTALRNVLLKLSAPDALPKEARAEMERLGISLEFLKDKTIPIQEKFETLKPLLKDNASIVKVFGTENAAAAINVISHTDRLKELTSKMGEVGSATQQAAVKMDTVNNKTELLKAKYDSLVLSIGSGSGVVSGFFKFFITGADGALTSLIRLNSSWDELNKKAKQEGQKSGKNSFQQRFNNLMGTGTDAEIAQSIKSVAERDYKILQKEYAENAKKLKDFNPYAINFGESGKDLELKKEQLTKRINEQATIIREAAKKINDFNKSQKEEEIKINQEAETTKSEIQIEADKKAVTARAKAAAKRKADEEKAEKERIEKIKAAVLAKAQLDKAELENYLVNNRTKINAETKLTDEVVAEETKRLDNIRFLQDNELANERLRKIEAAQADFESGKINAETLANEKAAIDLEYLTKKQELDLQFDKDTYDLRKKAEADRKQEEAEALLVQKEIDLAEAETEREIQTAQENERYQTELIALEDRLRKGKLTEDQYRILRAKAEKDHSNAMIQIAHAERDAKLAAMGQLFGGIAKLLGENTKAGQIAALAEVAISQGLAVARIWETKSTLPSPFDIAAKVGGTAVAIANVISAAKQIKSVKTPKFFYGGDTGTTAHLGYDEYGPVTGLVHKNEYVIPEVMTANPRYANTIAWLEQERTGRVKKFADGGETSPGTLPSGIPDTISNQNEMLAFAIATLNTILANGITAKTIIGYEEAKGIEDLNNERAQSAANAIVNE